MYCSICGNYLQLTYTDYGSRYCKQCRMQRTTISSVVNEPTKKPRCQICLKTAMKEAYRYAPGCCILHTEMAMKRGLNLPRFD